MIKKDVGYCWEKRDVIAESGHLFRLVKAGFIREHEFLIIGKEKKILQVANSLYLCSRKKNGMEHSWLARHVRDVEVGRSSRLITTI